MKKKLEQRPIPRVTECPPTHTLLSRDYLQSFFLLSTHRAAENKDISHTKENIIEE